MPVLPADSVTVLAVDWSGAVRPESKMWLAEVRGGALTELRGGWTRDSLVDYLIERAATDHKLVVGLDFAFSMPLQFLAERSITRVKDLWQHVQTVGETWLKGCQPPFWGRAGRRRPDAEERWHFRQTELEVPRIAGIRPKSVFQIGGPGTVGTGSIRGMPYLLKLQEAGFSIWPFDLAGWPRVVEIYPRLFTKQLAKSNRAARAAYLAGYQWNEELVASAVKSDDALDAAISAVVMAQHAEELVELNQVAGGSAVLEGLIWHPNWGNRPSVHD